jgi:hypothetical protein
VTVRGSASVSSRAELSRGQVTETGPLPGVQRRHSDTIEASGTPMTDQSCRATASTRSLALPAARVGLPSDDSSRPDRAICAASAVPVA